MKNYLRIIFAGTPFFAMQHLDTLIQAEHQIIGVLTQPDKPSGRGNSIIINPVKQLAKKYHLPIFQPFSLKTPENIDNITKLNADIIVVVAYGLIFPKELLDIPKLGCINVHGSLLPRWRGAAPIQRALWAGDTHTGVTIIQMDAGLDTGDILNKTIYAIKPNDTSLLLYKKLAQIGSKTLLITLEQLTKNNIIAKPQDNLFATYAHKLSKKEALIDWQKPAIHIERCIRAFNPWPVSYFSVAEQNIKVWSANIDSKDESLKYPGTILAADKNGIKLSTGKGILTLTELQLAGKKVISVKELLNSYKKLFIPNTILH